MNPDFENEHDDSELLSERDMAFLQSWEKKQKTQDENPEIDALDDDAPIGIGEGESDDDEGMAIGVGVGDDESDEEGEGEGQGQGQQDNDAQDEQEQPQDGESGQESGKDTQEGQDDPEADDDELQGDTGDEDPGDIPETKDGEDEGDLDGDDDGEEYDPELDDEEEEKEEGNGEPKDQEGEGDEGEQEPPKDDEDHTPNEKGQSKEKPEDRPECEGNCPEVQDLEDDDIPCPYCNRNRGKLVCLDRDGEEVFHGDLVNLRTGVTHLGMHQGPARVYNESDAQPSDNGDFWQTFQCVVQEGQGSTKWKWKGQDCWTFRSPGRDGKVKKFPWMILDPSMKEKREFEEQMGGGGQQEHDHGGKQDEQDDNRLEILDRDGNTVRHGDICTVHRSEDKMVGPSDYMIGHEYMLVYGAENTHGKTDPRIPGFVVAGDSPKFYASWKWKGEPCWTFSVSSMDKETGRFLWIEKMHYDDNDLEGDDEQGQEQEQEGDFEYQEGGDGKMTKNQRDRFASVCERIFQKSKQTFGKTVEKAEIGEVEDGLFYGEEINQTIEIESRGVIYRVSVSAERKNAKEGDS
jgi:hypothetical protein